MSWMDTGFDFEAAPDDLLSVQPVNNADIAKAMINCEMIIGYKDLIFKFLTSFSNLMYCITVTHREPQDSFYSNSSDSSAGKK
jgi:hypothetical protein